MILDKSVADQVSIWKKSKGLTDKVFSDHDCSGEKCSYHQIGDVFVCENTGYVHGMHHCSSHSDFHLLFNSVCW